MNEKLDWTQMLGEASLAQQENVMDLIEVCEHRRRRPGTSNRDSRDGPPFTTEDIVWRLVPSSPAPRGLAARPPHPGRPPLRPAKRPEQREVYEEREEPTACDLEEVEERRDDAQAERRVARQVHETAPGVWHGHLLPELERHEQEGNLREREEGESPAERARPRAPTPSGRGDDERGEQRQPEVARRGPHDVDERTRLVLGGQHEGPDDVNAAAHHLVAHPRLVLNHGGGRARHHGEPSAVRGADDEPEEGGAGQGEEEPGERS